ncbi:MAG: hypothetical protein KF893_01335 [Caldilineaceae bacterium]|nr:hypothetical protein [Caldilineaceae bacterium]
MNFEIDFTQETFPIVRESSLVLISKSHTLRCDAKQAEKRFVIFDQLIEQVDFFQLGEYLPDPFVKGSQPSYVESLDSVGIPVINTLSIQDMAINLETCRYISEEDFAILDENRKLRSGDVLLTMDGGTSIGKPALFNIEDDFTVDSHVAILRPVGIEPMAIVYLLASPLGQMQFQRAESGASGQTAVTEYDVRRFRFPKVQVKTLSGLVEELNSAREAILREKENLRQRERASWEQFNRNILKHALNKTK